MTALPSLWHNAALTRRGRQMVTVFVLIARRGGAVGLRDVCDVLHMTNKQHVRVLCDEMVMRGFLCGWRDQDKPNEPYVYDVADVYKAG